jgi:dihydroorotase
VRSGELNLERSVAALTQQPARILGLAGGSLTLGEAADLTIIDPNLELTLEASDLESKGKNSPFLGKKLQGFPVLTMVKGRIVMQDRKLITE